VRIDLHLQLQLQVHKKTLSPRKVPDFDPSPLATISTWEAETWYALLCRIDLGPQKVSARTDSIYEIRTVHWAYKQYLSEGVCGCAVGQLTHLADKDTPAFEPRLGFGDSSPEGGGGGACEAPSAVEVRACESPAIRNVATASGSSMTNGRRAVVREVALAGFCSSWSSSRAADAHIG